MKSVAQMIAAFSLAMPMFLGHYASAAAPETKLEIGQKAPDWSGIVGVDDEKHALEDYKKSDVVVLVFTCNHCPVAKAYEDRLVALQKDFKDKSVQLIAVNVNNLEQDKLPAMKVRAKEKEFNFPYLYDPTQEIGKDYGAKTTPHVFVLNDDREIAYIGGIDDSMDPEKVKTHHLRNAITALLDGEKPDPALTRNFGCSIKYED